jgi:hypothetical protein
MRLRRHEWPLTRRVRALAGFRRRDNPRNVNGVSKPLPPIPQSHRHFTNGRLKLPGGFPQIQRHH